MTIDILRAISGLQSDGSSGIPEGNFPSHRYHPVLPITRQEDNVYFLGWICQCLMRNEGLMTDEERHLSSKIRKRAQASLVRYRSRYGAASYNFYRPEEWFPNGHVLHRFRTFQPTDDADDSCIAYRGFVHSEALAKDLKTALGLQANGQNEKCLKRGPKAIRDKEVYNTWIGSKGLFVDFDLVVICNVLMFNARYDLGCSEVDRNSIDLIQKLVSEGGHLTEPWSSSAWYPFKEVILYSLADLISTGYYASLMSIKNSVVRDLELCISSPQDMTSQLLCSSALMKLDVAHPLSGQQFPIPDFIEQNKSFSFGVIPLLHPFNGRLAQRLSSWSGLRLLYRCDAHVLAIWLENLLLSRK